MMLTGSEEAENRVRQRLDIVLRNPTGYYRSRINSDVTATQGLVHDSNVIYGPWLEGIGSRNATTRFKGYHHWRRTVQYLEQEEGPAILERHFPVLVKRLG